MSWWLLSDSTSTRIQKKTIHCHEEPLRVLVNLKTQGYIIKGVQEIQIIFLMIS